jgi:hypothetical protein
VEEREKLPVVVILFRLGVKNLRVLKLETGKSLLVNTSYVGARSKREEEKILWHVQ